MRTNLLALAALSVLTACGPSRGAYTCEEAPGWSFEVAPRCRSVAYNLRLAERLLGQPLPAVEVYVGADGALGDPDLSGNYDARWGVSLACDGKSFLHEVLHLVDLREGHALTFAHAGWDESGAWFMADTYKAEAASLGACASVLH